MPRHPSNRQAKAARVVTLSFPSASSGDCLYALEKFKQAVHTLATRPERIRDRLWYDRLTVYVLVGFCGIRVEEASRLRWTNLDLQRQIVEVPATVAKKASFRNNRIPPNAMAWLRAVEDKRRTGPIIGPNWKNLLRIAVRFCPIDYRQNCVRHSFCSYALADGWSLPDVISSMGYSGSPAMIFSHYWNVVSAEDGKRWFEIVP